MNRNFTLILLGIFMCSCSFGQTFRLHGKITNTQLEPLAFASVQVKNFPSGVISNQNGEYELRLDEGRYEIIFSMVGYAPRVLAVVISKADYLQNIIMEPDNERGMSEVVVSARIKDRGEEIIREVIRNKEAVVNAAGEYSCRIYIKAIQEDSSRVNRKKKKSRDKQDGIDSSAERQRQVDSIDAVMNRLALAEVVVRLDVGEGYRIREEREGISKKGRVEDLFYLSATEGNFSFYQNLLNVPRLSQIPILSPISYSGLLAYRFRLIKTEHTRTGKVYTISVKPRQLSNATVEGELRIADSTWIILGTRLSFPAYHLPVYNFFEVQQEYSLVDGKAWMITKQQFNYYSRGSKGNKSGSTTVSYKDFELNKVFDRKHFGVEVSSTSQEAYERDSTFWLKSRPEPLKEKELQLIRYRDSVYRVTHSTRYLDSLDSVINRITWKKLLFMGQSFNDHRKESSWHLPPLPSVYQPFQFGGARLSFGFFHAKTFKTRKNFSVSADLSYGLRNRDVNGSVRFNRLYNPFNRGFYHFNMGRNFEYIFSGDAWINMLKRSNIFLNNSVGFGHGIELVNGLFLYSDIDIAVRRSVSNYRINDKVDSLLGGVLENNEPVDFEPYNAFYGRLRLQYTPFQRFIREPREKIILGSKWPTFYTMWRKGIPGVMGSKVDFDYLEFGMEQDLKLGLLGISRYNVKSGTFLNQADLRLVDYQFQRRGDPILFNNPHEAFQMLDSTFPLFKRFYQSHLVHDFNGAIINKVPLLKQLKLREVAGGGFLIAPERNLRYVELFGGVERVFNLWFSPGNKVKLGVYVVGSAANQFRNPVMFKVGITTWDKRRGRWF